MLTGALCRRTHSGMRLLALAMVCAMVGGPALAASKTTLGGKIISVGGTPVKGATVSVLQPGSEKVLFSTTSGDTGLYAIDNLEVGTYHIRLEPGTKDLRGDTVKADVSEKGLIVNWRVSAAD